MCITRKWVCTFFLSFYILIFILFHNSKYNECLPLEKCVYSFKFLVLILWATIIWRKHLETDTKMPIGHIHGSSNMHGQEPLWRNFLNSNCSAVLDTNSFKGWLIVYSSFIWRWHYWQWKAAKDGVTLILNWPRYIYFFGKFNISSRKLHDIFCIFCTLKLHNLQRTFIPH